MITQEQQLIDEIRSLFKEMIEEEDERFDIVTKRTIFPRNYMYVSKAKDLLAKTIELEKINSKYSTYELKSVFNKELYFVDKHQYEYEKNSLIPRAKSVKELQNLMHNVTHHIQMYFFDVLGDIKID